jgi:hypothetical protein
MEFSPTFEPFEKRPHIQWFRSKPFSVIRDNFTLTTWLLIGATIQSAITMILQWRFSITLAIPAAALCITSLPSLLVLMGLKQNSLMDNAIPGRVVPVFPDENGHRQQPGGKQICCLIIAAKSNHPLGMLGPGYDVVGEYFGKMMKELNKSAAEHGFLGGSNWIGQERPTSNEVMSVLYFESLEALHGYAHGPLHSKAMEWWNATEKQIPHVAIMHEIFLAPPGHWEGIYMNYSPTGLGATSTRVQRKLEGGGEATQWVNPLVKGVGKLKYSKGRMNAAFDTATEWPAFEKAGAAHAY